MTRVKGTALLATLRFVRERFGDDGLKKVVADLTPDERIPIDEGVLASSWYPFALILHVTQLAVKHYGAQMPELIRELGKASAEYGLTTVYKLFFKVGSPHFIISKASSLFPSYYDTGAMKAVVSERGHAIIELTGFAEPAPELCERIQGWMQRTIELSGGKDFRIKHETCAARGAKLCVYEGWWA